MPVVKKMFFDFYRSLITIKTKGYTLPNSRICCPIKTKQTMSFFTICTKDKNNTLCTRRYKLYFSPYRTYYHSSSEQTIKLMKYS